MQDQGIIEKANGTTPWLSPIPKKGGDLRIVLDIRVPYRALQRRRIQFLTVVFDQMEGAAIFTEVDLSQDYLHISLAEESCYITAFQTPDDGPYHAVQAFNYGSLPIGRILPRNNTQPDQVHPKLSEYIGQYLAMVEGHKRACKAIRSAPSDPRR